LSFLVERDENDMRKEPTVSERVALAEAITEGEKKAAEGRMKAGGQPPGNISCGSDAGQVRDIIAQKVGLGSGKTLEPPKRWSSTARPSWSPRWMQARAGGQWADAH
jgi:ParB family chromosome partitioning protein